MIDTPQDAIYSSVRRDPQPRRLRRLGGRRRSDVRGYAASHSQGLLKYIVVKV